MDDVQILFQFYYFHAWWAICALLSSCSYQWCPEAQVPCLHHFQVGRNPSKLVSVWVQKGFCQGGLARVCFCGGWGCFGCQFGVGVWPSSFSFKADGFKTLRLMVKAKRQQGSFATAWIAVRQNARTVHLRFGVSGWAKVPFPTKSPDVPKKRSLDIPKQCSLDIPKHPKALQP